MFRKTYLFAWMILGSATALVSWNNAAKAPALDKEVSKKFVYVPSGTMQLDSMMVSVQGFLISKTEVSNAEYREFLQYINANGSAEEKAAARIDTAAWKMESFAAYYHKHPAYTDYPVVNVQHEAAVLYCKWLSEKWTKASKTGTRYYFRLPERAEFIRAARGETNNPYAWDGPYLRNSKGAYLCNFARIGAEDIHRNQETGKLDIVFSNPGIAGSLADNADITAPSESYFPNAFGIYNLNGNVAEMIAKKGVATGGCWASPGYDVRNESTQIYDGPSSKVGFRPVMTFMRKQKQ